MDEMILFMGHGSRDSDGVREFQELISALKAAAPMGCAIEAGVLEFARPGVPSIQEAIDRCVAAGARRVLAVPVLLFNAGHSKADLPAQIVRGRARHPALDLRLAQPLGVHRSLLEIAEERLTELADRLSPRDMDQTAVLLVGRGTSDAEANGDVFKIGRLIWERNRYDLVECCFAGTAAPLVPAGIDRCVRLGARRILVLPYFLNTGILVKRIHTQARATQEAYPDVQIAVGGHFGVHPKLTRLLLTRAKIHSELYDGLDDSLMGGSWSHVHVNHHRAVDGDHEHQPDEPDWAR